MMKNEKYILSLHIYQIPLIKKYIGLKDAILLWQSEKKMPSKSESALKASLSSGQFYIPKKN